MNRKIYFLSLLIVVSNCVGTDVIDDLVPERVEITNPITSLKIGDTYDLMFRYLNNIGEEDFSSVKWESSNSNVISIDETGKIEAHLLGTSIISVVLVSNDSVMDEISVDAANETIVASSGLKKGTIESTSSYELKGDFEMENVSGGVRINIKSNYTATEALPGLYVYLSNNPNTVDGALEIGAVTVYSGEHSYDVLDSNLNVDTYAYLLYFCKPFNVKVGHGEILN